MGSSPQFETKNFIFITVESSDETRFCVSHEGIPIGLGRLFFTGIALAIKIPSQNEEAPHYKKLLLTKYTDSTLTLREACLPIYIHHTMVPFISISYLPHHSWKICWLWEGNKEEKQFDCTQSSIISIEGRVQPCTRTLCVHEMSYWVPLILLEWLGWLGLLLGTGVIFTRFDALLGRLQVIFCLVPKSKRLRELVGEVPVGAIPPVSRWKEPGVHFSLDVLLSWADRGWCAHECVC